MKFPTQRDCVGFYGDPVGNGGAVQSPVWFRASIVYVEPRWAMRMGSIEITRIPVHFKIEDAVNDVFDEIAGSFSIAQIKDMGMDQFGGSNNFRPMRGGTALSMHSFGVAIDFDPARNGLGDRTPHLAKYPRLLEIFAAHGAVWGGDWDGDGDTLDERRCDGMHFQWARL
jgi:hypothetical protein